MNSIVSCRYGLSRSDQLIYPDPELRFKETVPQAALFDPNANQGEEAHSRTEQNQIQTYHSPSDHPAESVGKRLQFSDNQNDSGDSEEEEEEEEGEGEEGGEGGGKCTADAPASSVVPLGWPKVRTE